MGFGPVRAPFMEDVAELIAREIKSAEGHGATSEVPMSFLQRSYRIPIHSARLRRERLGVASYAAAVAAIALVLAWAWAG
ncbi:hypothetical protein [Sinorhizobium sp. BJ1]|uniref:hypothetical protein n=1 Tax=Sinorhizobium sp. BJ1 TaxID=2035455 RepID=UPI001FDFCAF1|nr:hypothetical protein [Sinorhizobium sp. BJ1]